jgi:hypothetical protein
MDEEYTGQEPAGKVKHEKNAVQEVIDVPWIGDTIGLFIGLFPPLVLTLFFGPDSDNGGIDKIKANLLMSFLIFAWTSFLYFVCNVNVALPLSRIPLFVIGLLGVAYQLFQYFRF